jgi:hypothetical protein
MGPDGPEAPPQAWAPVGYRQLCFRRRRRSRPGAHPRQEQAVTRAPSMRAACLTLSMVLLASVGLAACGSSSSTTRSPSTAGAAGHTTTMPAAHAATRRASPTRSSRGRSSGSPRGAFGALGDPRYRRALAAFAACVRRHGINLPPPNTTGRGPIFTSKGIDVRSQRFRTATASCRGILARASRR